MRNILNCPSTFLSLLCLGLGACASTPAAIGIFEDNDEVFYGTATPAYSPDSKIFLGDGRFLLTGRDTGTTCTGRISITNIPPDKTCRGQKGKVTAQCDDNRTLEATWSAASCITGSGQGQDDSGTAFAFTFGVPEKKPLNASKNSSAYTKAGQAGHSPNTQNSQFRKDRVEMFFRRYHDSQRNINYFDYIQRHSPVYYL